MKKKVLLIALVLMVIAVSGVFATGVGIQGGLDFLGTPYGSNIALSLKLDELPFMLDLGWNLTSTDISIGASADWWMYNSNLTGIIDLYMGPGVFAGFSTSGTGNFWLGPRVAAGLQIFVLDPLEFFVEIDPFLTLLPTIDFGFQGAAGVRFWF